jgi:hypothetical protein
MAQSLTLKWGNVKTWEGAADGTPFRAALDKWCDSGQSISAMQRQTPKQRELICAIIDAVEGEIYDGWNGGTMTKDAAKAYVRDYGSEKKHASA